MFGAKVLFGIVLLVAAVSAHSINRYVDNQEYEEVPYIQYFDQHQPLNEEEFYHPGHVSRVRRQAQGSITFNSDGSTGLAAKVPLVGNNRNALSAVGTMDFNNQMKSSSHGLGLALDSVNGHGLTVMRETVPGFGNRLTGAGRLNLFRNDNHNVNANAFATRNMPHIPQMPNFNTVGGGLDYTFKNKVGASVGMASTPFFQRKDYSAMGNLNLFRTPTSSLDFSGGVKKFETPIMKSPWKPNFGLSFSRSF